MVEIGKQYNSNLYGKVTVLEVDGNKRITVQWENTGNVDVVQKGALLKGLVADRKLKNDLAMAAEATRKSSAKAYFDKLAENSRKRSEAKKVREAKKVDIALREAAKTARRLELSAVLEDTLRYTAEAIVPKDKPVIPIKDAVNTILFDFKDRTGKWVLRFKCGGVFYQTRLGKLHNGISQRANIGGSIQNNSSCYSGVRMSDLFSCPQSFCDWVVKQVGWDEGFQIDKDLLSTGSKIYSEETCVFIPREINTAIIRRKFIPYKDSKGMWPVTMMVSRRNVVVGKYDSPEAAEDAYSSYREAYIRRLAEEYKGRISDAAYNALLTWKAYLPT